MKLKDPCDRLHYEPRHHYNENVFIGKWAEEKFQYVKENHKHTTTYDREFYDKKYSRRSHWKNLISDQTSKIPLDGGEAFRDNYTSTNNIVYLPPRTKKEDKLRNYNCRLHTYIPQQDFIPCYGNLSEFGLRKLQKYKWKFETEVSNILWMSEVKDNYQAPDKKDYVKKHFANKREISSSLYSPNVTNYNLKFRDMRFAVVPDFPVYVKPRPYPHFHF